MIAVLVEFRIDPAHVEAFAARVAQQAADSLALEAGCLRFDVWTRADAPERVTLYELYADRDAFFEAHLKSAHFLAFDAAVAPMVADKTVAVLDRMLAPDPERSAPGAAS